jgi:hypothetical protein
VGLQRRSLAGLWGVGPQSGDLAGAWKACEVGAQWSGDLAGLWSGHLVGLCSRGYHLILKFIICPLNKDLVFL